MSPVARQVLAAFSLANLLFLRVWFELNHLQHEPMHQYWLGRAATTADYFTAISVTLLLAVLLLPLVRFMLQRQRAMVAAACAAVVLILLGRFLYLAIGLSELVPEMLWLRIQDETGSLWHSGAGGPALLLICVLLVMAPGSRAWLANIGPALAIVLTLLAPFGLAMAAVAAKNGWLAREGVASAQPSAPESGQRPPLPGARRVIVAVFDELDYRLAFESPPQEPALKGLARLRASSLFATQAFPPSNATAISMPALLMGERLLNIRTDRIDRLDLHQENGGVISFGDSGTLVHRAVRDGHRVGMIGWYHAYCRLFTMTADCLDSPAQGYSTSYPAASLLDIARSQWRQVVPLGTSFAVARHEKLAARFRRMIADPTLGLVFAHFSIPHGPNIYDSALERMADAERASIKGTDTVNYFSNLLLVDRLVDETLDSIKADCADCMLIVTSDHWWRWARHYDGRTDRRVPFAVVTGGDTGSTLLERKFNTEFLAHLVMAMLRQEVSSRADIARWIERHGRARDPVSAPWMADEDRMATSHDPPGMPR